MILKLLYCEIEYFVAQDVLKILNVYESQTCSFIDGTTFNYTSVFAIIFKEMLVLIQYPTMLV
ncbi:hypothetical protein G293_04100 [Candidatus Liberibacter africanus PTSAPSY]|uniref:Uncharacterized protein n=1 Tax=Candidatus Liberibacter africanus PTSAPSY TaxID=1277257 RepID=A0A0G3I3L8_LIBAF|nr:hypothetical protein G293_04100 [Candidatus Liberibacter africanus PTSAPSY]